MRLSFDRCMAVPLREFVFGLDDWSVRDAQLSIALCSASIAIARAGNNRSSMELA
jgi:hypothetical protein